MGPKNTRRNIYTQENTLINYNATIKHTGKKGKQIIRNNANKKSNILGKHTTHRENCRMMEMHQTNMPNNKQKITPLVRHIAKQHPENTSTQKNRHKMPTVWKTYNALSSVLKHLKYKQKHTWPIGTCPIKQECEDIKETWGEILKYNKYMQHEEQGN